VVLMTIHSAKGLEFPRVFLPGFEEGIFPGLQTVMAGPEEIEEERRLAYVAITRAKDQLYILHAKSRMLYGHTSCNPASRFLAEIPERLLDNPREQTPHTPVMGARGYAQADHARQVAARDRITVGRPKPQPASNREMFAPGDRVQHAQFGNGVILSVTKMAADSLYEIAFDTVGTKRMMATYVKLKKL
jgi:DNA helicase-2/ATP-dependent DNA helicase PcrA